MLRFGPFEYIYVGQFSLLCWFLTVNVYYAVTYWWSIVDLINFFNLNNLIFYFNINKTKPLDLTRPLNLTLNHQNLIYFTFFFVFFYQLIIRHHQNFTIFMKQTLEKRKNTPNTKMHHHHIQCSYDTFLLKCILSLKKKNTLKKSKRMW